MARRARSDDDDDDRVHSHASPPPSFLSLPDIAHASIASFLPDGDTGKDNRLCVSEVSHAMFESYCGSLTDMHLRYVEGRSATRLAALLSRQSRIAELEVHKRKTIPALSQAIVQGCCRNVEKTDLSIWEGDALMEEEELDLLAYAFEKESALRALKELRVGCMLAPGALSRLAKSLIHGAAPQLQILNFFFANATGEDMDSVADMLEACARIPGCARLERFEGIHWDRHVSVDALPRILCALLPSIRELIYFDWSDAFEPCFREVQAPHLTSMEVSLKGSGGVLSWNVFEAVPALVRLAIEFSDAPHLGGVVGLQSVGMAIRHGALRNLEYLSFSSCDVKDEGVRDFLNALQESDCAQSLECLFLHDCNVGVERVYALADLLRRGTLPALYQLSLSETSYFTHVGVAALAAALPKASQSNWAHLDLMSGWVTQASLCWSLLWPRATCSLSDGGGVTNEGMILLAQAISGGSLSALERFEMVCYSKNITLLGVGALAHAVVNGCPELGEIYLTKPASDEEVSVPIHEMIEGMVHRAGRNGGVNVLRGVDSTSSNE